MTIDAPHTPEPKNLPQSIGAYYLRSLQGGADGIAIVRHLAASERAAWFRTFGCTFGIGAVVAWRANVADPPMAWHAWAWVASLVPLIIGLYGLTIAVFRLPLWQLHIAGRCVSWWITMSKHPRSLMLDIKPVVAVHRKLLANGREQTEIFLIGIDGQRSRPITLDDPQHAEQFLAIFHERLGAIVTLI